MRVQFPGQRRPLCRLKVEITHDELVLWPEVSRPLQHNYAEPLEAELDCYALEEIAAEKLRALLQSAQRLRERGWGASRVGRDYYDLWRLLNEGRLDRSRFLPRLERKCEHRGVGFESPADFTSAALVETARRECVPPTGPICTGLPGG